MWDKLLPYPTMSLPARTSCSLSRGPSYGYSSTGRSFLYFRQSQQFLRMAGVTTKGNTNDGCELLPIPSATVGYEREWPCRLSPFTTGTTSPWSRAMGPRSQILTKSPRSFLSASCSLLPTPCSLLISSPHPFPRAVAYIVLAPDNDSLMTEVRTFIKVLSNGYESLKLGRHASGPFFVPLLDPIGSLDILGILCLCVCMFDSFSRFNTLYP